MCVYIGFIITYLRGRLQLTKSADFSIMDRMNDGSKWFFTIRKESSMPKKGKLIVQKYGGTSVSSIEKIIMVAERIKEYRKQGFRLVVVVSACGDETDALIQMANEAMDEVLDDSSSGIVPQQRELDQLLQTGEVRSAALLAIILNAMDVPTISYSAYQLGLEAAGEYGKAKIKRLKNRKRILEQLENCVLVITGFQGLIEGSRNIATLGRGGSDATAVALAASLNAWKCEIYTDVDGVYAIDPRIVPSAKRFPRINYQQMYEMSASGAGVLMDRCVLIAQAHNVRNLCVLQSPSVGQTDGGTIVSSAYSCADMENTAYLAGIAIRKDVAVLNINDLPNEPGIAAKVFKALADINILDAAQGQGGERAAISILIDQDDSERALAAMKKLKDIDASTRQSLVAITLIDPLMKENPGYFYRLASTLANEGINIEMITSTQTSIMAVVRLERLHCAAWSLAREFDLLK